MMNETSTVPHCNTAGLATLLAAFALSAATACASGGGSKLDPDVADLMAAADQDDVVRIEAVLDGGTSVGEVDLEGRTALMHAARNGSMAALDVLLEAGAIVTMTAPDGVTALMEAARAGQASAVTELAQRGAMVNRLSNLEYRPAAIHLAAWEDHTDCVRALLDAGSDLNLFDGTNSTPLMYAAYFNGPDAARFLVEAGADLTPRDTDGLTALGLAQDQGNQEIEELLLSVGAP